MVIVYLTVHSQRSMYSIHNDVVSNGLGVFSEVGVRGTSGEGAQNDNE